MEKRLDKEKIQNKIEVLKTRREFLEKEMKSNILEIKKLNTSIDKSNILIRMMTNVMCALTYFMLVFSTLPVALISGGCIGFLIFQRVREQNKIEDDVKELLNNNQKGIIELGKVYDEIIECSLKLKENGTDNVNKTDYSLTEEMVIEDITKKEEVGHQKVKKIRGSYEKNI